MHSEAKNASSKVYRRPLLRMRVFFLFYRVSWSRVQMFDCLLRWSKNGIFCNLDISYRPRRIGFLSLISLFERRFVDHSLYPYVELLPVFLRRNMKCIYICMRNASGLPTNLEIHESIKFNHFLAVHEYCSLAPVFVDMRWDHFRLKRPNLQRFENSQVWLKKIVRNNLSTGNANFWDDNCSISHAFHIHVYLVYWLRQGLADFGLNYILTVQNH